MTRTAHWLMLLLFGCGTAAPDGGDDGTTTPSTDAGSDDGGDPVTDPCAVPLAIPTAGRVIDLMPATRLADIAARAPCVPPGALRDLLESPRTLWYDRASLVPGYQDSFGDNIETPIGMRPNTIDPELIDLAVPGGHAQIFAAVGRFQFPFGNPIGAQEPVVVVDFWHPPEGRPVVYWRRDPNEYTHRVEWMFPRDTVFGEMLFLSVDGTLWPFEIRTRTRTLAGWAVDVFRPFPRASDLADAIVATGASSPALDALVAQLRGDSLQAFTVSGTHFAGAFPARSGGIELLPALAGTDADRVHALLRTTPFRSARGVYWKETPTLRAWAAGASGTGTIVPRGYNAAAVEVSETSCDGCHRDAGRPFRTWYENILAYGELWGNDETFTWHPFTIAKFVDAAGSVQNFNHDNREIRSDFAAAGLVAPYSPTQHPPTIYKRIVREWTDFVY